MAPIKFEEHIKDQLEKRRIEPSAAGWDRISAQLVLKQGQKKSKRVLWMSIAASFIIGAVLTAIFLNDNAYPTPEVVKTPSIIIDQPLQEQFKKPPLTPETNAKEARIARGTSPEKPQKQATPSKKAAVAHRKSSAIAIDHNEHGNKGVPAGYAQNKKQTQKQATGSTSHTQMKLPDAYATNKIEEVVTLVQERELVTDQEIEDLLRDAQRDIVSKQLPRLSALEGVNARELLLDAEYEVDPETFKDKIFKSLKREFGKALDAVANKDN